MSDNRKLYKRIADTVADDIRSGQYRVGDRIPPERDLAITFGVSRPTVREAMIALEIMGFIEARQGHGMVVTKTQDQTSPIADSEIGAFELIETRRLFEGEVAALAASQITDEHLAELEKLTDMMLCDSKELDEKADRDFHVLIAQVTGNGAMVATVENLWDWRHRSPLARNILSRAAHINENDRVSEHRRIIEALRSRNAATARLAMHQHMERVIDHLLEATEMEAVEKARQASDERRKAITKRLDKSHAKAAR